MMLASLTILGAIVLGYVNGANDVSKGVATLVGSGVTSYRRALAWGTVWTVFGAVAAYAASACLLQTFSTRLVSPVISASPAFPLAVAGGASIWVLVATQTGLPVSTTHSLTGAIVGAALMGAGMSGVAWELVAAAVAAPLALSPLLSGLLGWIGYVTFGRRVATASQYCVCLEQYSCCANRGRA